MFSGPVSPEHSKKFLCPFAFGPTQNFAQVAQDGAVADFGLTFALKIIGRGESMCDFALVTETCHLLTKFVSLSENGMRGPKATYYVLPKELDDVLPGDFGERHYLDPFGEVVGDYQKKSYLRLSRPSPIPIA